MAPPVVAEEPRVGSVDATVLEELLSLQRLVAWVGEDKSDPPRLGCWRTGLVDEFGGEDLVPLYQLFTTPSTASTRQEREGSYA